MDESVILGCVTTAEDKDLDYEACCDIRLNHLASSDSKTSNALKHLDIFLRAYCKKIKAPYIDSCHLTYYGIKTSGTFEEANTWWDDMIGSFFSYLYKDAYSTEIRIKAEFPTKPQLGTHQVLRSSTPPSFATVALNSTYLVLRNGENSGISCFRN